MKHRSVKQTELHDCTTQRLGFGWRQAELNMHRIDCHLGYMCLVMLEEEFPLAAPPRPLALPYLLVPSEGDNVITHIIIN